MVKNSIEVKGFLGSAEAMGTAQYNRKDFLQGVTYAHSSQTLIPHMLVPPQECTPSLSNSSSTATPPFPLASKTCQIRNSKSFVAATGIPPGELTSPSKISHLERVSHRFDNLLLQSQQILSHLERVAHKPDNLLLQTSS
jgi:hypothetical protein